MGVLAFTGDSDCWTILFTQNVTIVIMNETCPHSKVIIIEYSCVVWLNAYSLCLDGIRGSVCVGIVNI